MSELGIARLPGPGVPTRIPLGRSLVAVLLASLLSSSAAHAQQQAPPPARQPDPWMVPPGYPQAPGAPPPPGGASAGFGENPDQSGVFVELRSDNPSTRIDQVFDGGMTVPVCQAPCRKVLSRNNQYVIQGDGMRSTSRFLLPDDRQEVTLDVQAGSTSRLTGGVILLVAGGGVAYVGMVTWLLGTAANSSPNDTGTGTSGSGASQTRAGAVMMIVGIPAAVIGLYLALTTQTHVTSSTGSTFTEEPPVRRKPSAIAFTARGIEF